MATLPQQDHSALDGSAADVAAKVFVIPELLEMILLPLHQETLQLFPLRRVNSTFHDLIRGSKVLRHYLKIQHLATDPIYRGFLFNPVIPVPHGMIDICSPLDIFSTRVNKIYVKLNSEWDRRFKGSPTHTMVLLMVKPMSMKVSWREIVIAKGGDMRIRLLIPRGPLPHPLIAMEKDATLGWLVDRYMADLRAEMEKIRCEVHSRKGWCTFRRSFALLKEEVSLLRDGDGEGAREWMLKCIFSSE
ncbi:hypothetical protein LTR56_008855 [Elasticomyces elasticus]|nr:hypothetical protein LTR22_015847 [Elasticomyces elasticus]KAK3645977.1 hypothetical protein LTR56_008855 [Elasticomyces elasticus]KAK4914845.1 hypothetical protein LTR49_016957 [Elasticomyces elasticus]